MEQLINTIYKNASMGILGINEVLYKIQNKKLYKIIQKEKREYEKVLREIKRISKKYDIPLVEINPVIKFSSELLSQMKLMKDSSDEIIIQMMIDGTNKSINILENDGNNITNSHLIKIYDNFIKILNDNIKELSNI